MGLERRLQRLEDAARPEQEDEVERQKRLQNAPLADNQDSEGIFT